RFQTTDPVYGGGDNRYGYPGDPINQYDLDGKAWWNPIHLVRKWRAHRQRHASADMLHSAVNFGIGFSPGGWGRSAARGTLRLRHLRQSCSGGWGKMKCAWNAWGISSVYDTAWYGRNTYRHGKRFAYNGLAYAYNSFTPRWYPRYTYRPWRGRF
ncbi:hypothetical protein, partial [Streptomyces erythrochromogenes]|uniref:hypothetical protein n=1 Tax=Streptomyces erythrochromogenes TaxID=285574 RepID=UPI0037CDE329